MVRFWSRERDWHKGGLELLVRKESGGERENINEEEPKGPI